MQKCVEQYWGAQNLASLNIKIVNEQPDSTSDAFEHFFEEF